MIPRWRTLFGNGAAATTASPSPAHAFAGWMLGTLFALLGLWLGDLGTHSLVPGVLLCGVVAVWSWRHLEWMFWVPALVVAATLVEPLAPLAVRGRYGVLVYVDVLMMALGLVGVVRAVALRQRLLPKTPVDGWMLALVALGLAAALPAWRDEGTLLRLKQRAIAILVFYVAAAIAGRPGGARWVWPAYPLALAVVGLHAVWASVGGPAALAANATAADQVWHSRMGLVLTLLAALPVSVALAMDAGDTMARRLWQAACVLGATGLLLYVARAGVLPRPVPPRGVEHPLLWALLGVAWVTLASLARYAWQLAAERRAEAPRWRAVALVCLAMPLAPLFGYPISGTAALLLTATAGGLVVGARRADLRSARHSDEVLAAVLREAA